MARTVKAPVKKERKPMGDLQKVAAVMNLAKRMGGLEELTKTIALCKRIAKIIAK